jgi:hypothetical protein
VHWRGALSGSQYAIAAGVPGVQINAAQIDHPKQKCLIADNWKINDAAGRVLAAVQLELELIPVSRDVYGFLTFDSNALTGFLSNARAKLGSSWHLQGLISMGPDGPFAFMEKHALQYPCFRFDLETPRPKYNSKPVAVR